MSDKEITLPVAKVLDMCRVAELDERAKIVAWLRQNPYPLKRIDHVLANAIQAGEHLK